MKKYTSSGQYQTGCRVALLSVLLICQGARADPVLVTSSNFTQILHDPSGNYQLVEDIVWPQAWEPWNFPPFSGVFNGDNHVVHNATLFVEPGQGTGQGGFFQVTDGAVIKNLAFYRLQVSGYNLSGLLSGSARDSVFTNIRCIDCTVTGQPGEDAALLFGSSVNNSVSGVEIDGSAIALPGLAGVDGMAGANGQMGAAINSTLSTVSGCTNNGADGMNGNPGTIGIDGNIGMNGMDGGNAALLAEFSLNSRYHNLLIHSGKIAAGRGGDGGAGGAGGKGGKGSKGQNGGAVSCMHAVPISDRPTGGRGGRGGKGGQGGNGATGGDAGNGGSSGVLMTKGTNNTVDNLLTHLNFLPGHAGNPGSGGHYGSAGQGGAGGDGGECITPEGFEFYCINGERGNAGNPGDKGDMGDPGMPGVPGTVLYPATENSVSNVFINSNLNATLASSTYPGLNTTDELLSPDTYTNLDKSRWRVVAGLLPYPTQLDALYLASANLDNAPEPFAYPGCWFPFGTPEGFLHTLGLQGQRVHGLFSVPERLGSSYWMMFRQNGDRLPLNTACGTEQFEYLNPGGALVDAFIPLGQDRALVIWRIPDTGQGRLAFVNFPDRQPVFFEPSAARIDGIVRDYTFLGDNLALVTETGLWLVDLSETSPETSEIITANEGILQQLWSNHHNRLYIVAHIVTEEETQTIIITSLLMDQGQVMYPSSEQADLEPGEQILAGTAGAGKMYLLSRQAGGNYQIRIQPEPGQPQPDRPEVINVNALLSGAAPELSPQETAIKAVGITLVEDTLHLLVCHQQALWWGVLSPDRQLIHSDRAELEPTAAVEVTGAEFVVEEDKITAFCTGRYDSGQPYWASTERNLLAPQAGSQAGIYTTPVMIMAGLLFFAAQ